MTSAELYNAAKEMGIEIDHHESDLYLPVNAKTRGLVAKHKFKTNVETFISQIDGKLWYDIPFAYQPFWDKAARASANA